MHKSSEKKLGITFAIVFSLIGLWPILTSGPIRLWSLSIAILFLAIAFLIPQILKPLNVAWMKLGEALGKIVAPIVMAFIFFTIVTPISFFVKILGKDLLALKFSKNNSYWIKRKKNITTMDKQF